MATLPTATCGDPCKKIRLLFLCCVSNSQIEVVDGKKKEPEGVGEEGEEEEDRAVDTNSLRNPNEENDTVSWDTYLPKSHYEK